MKINEVVQPEDLVRMVELIFGNTLAQIRNNHPLTSNPSLMAAPVTNPSPTKPQLKTLPKTPIRYKGSAKVKKVPYAPPPKALPKAKPLPSPVSTSQQQQEFAKNVVKAINPKVKMPKSLQPLPTSVQSPVDTVDKDFERKMNLARQAAERNEWARKNGLASG